MERVDFNLHRTVEDAMQTLRGQASAKGLAFGWRAAPGTLSLLRGDVNRLRQVLINLAANAIKFTERGEVTVEVGTESQGDGRATLRFAVNDTGIGIRPDQSADLFSPFVQADSSMTRKYGGTGLGLSISRQLVEMMGGKIGFQSTEGEGSTFWFTAVFDTASGAELPVASTGEPGRTGVVRSRRGARILVAEDNATNQMVLLAQLEKLGYQAHAVASGLEAVEALQHSKYDLILMDCQMPRMDGFEATRRIRELGCPDVPIVAVTANAMEGDRDRCIREGMNDYLSKPVGLRQLTQVLAKRLPGFVLRDALPTAEPAGGPTLTVFDEEDLLSRLVRDRQLAGQIVKAFVEDFPSLLSHLRKRLWRGRWTRLGTACARPKGGGCSRFGKRPSRSCARHGASRQGRPVA
jgi:CheY-like chemotaxis protein